MSDALRLHQLDARKWAAAMPLLAGIHPVDQKTLAALFARAGGSFDRFWDAPARARAAEVLTGDRPAERALLQQALVTLAGDASWNFPRGIAHAVHAVVGIDPERLQDLYALSGGPPRARVAQDEAARLLDERIELGFDLELPARFAPEPGEPGLVGAFSAKALAPLAELADAARARADLDARLAERSRGLLARLSGKAARCEALRRDLDAAWADWARLLEALDATRCAGAFLGIETLP